MAQPFSDETQELLNKAQQAIEHSLQLRDQSSARIKAAEVSAFKMHMALRRKRAESYGPKQ